MPMRPRLCLKAKSSTLSLPETPIDFGTSFVQYLLLL